MLLIEKGYVMDLVSFILFSLLLYVDSILVNDVKIRTSKTDYQHQDRRKRFSIDELDFSAFDKPALTLGLDGSDLLIRSIEPNLMEKLHLVNEHNRLRRTIPATNMRFIQWDYTLAKSAQKHADTCDFNHSRKQDRLNSGENIWAWVKPHYYGAVQMWFDEIYDDACNCKHAYKHCCGHYTQVVWAETNRMGCGFSECKGFIRC